MTQDPSGCGPMPLDQEHPRIVTRDYGNQSAGRPPQRTRAYLFILLGLLSAAGFADSFATSFRYRMLTYARADFGLEMSAAVGWTSWIYLASCLAFIPRMLADFVGRKLMLWITLLALCMMQWRIGWARTPTEYFAVLAAMAFFYKSDIWLIIISEEAPPLHRGLYTALMVAVSASGTVVLGALVSRMGEAPDAWRSVTRFAPLWLCFIPLIWLFVRETEAFRQSRAARGRLLNWAALLKPFQKPNLNKLVYLGILKALLVGGVTTTVSVVENDFLRVVHGINTGTMGILFQLDVLSIAAGWLVAGSVSDAIGRHKTLYGLAACYALSLLVFALSPVGTKAVLAAYVGQNFAFAGMFALLRLATVEFFPTDCRATASAWCDTIVVLFAAGNVRFVSWLLAAPEQSGLGLPISTILVAAAFVVPIVTPLFARLPETSRVELAQE